MAQPLFRLVSFFDLGSLFFLNSVLGLSSVSWMQPSQPAPTNPSSSLSTLVIIRGSHRLPAAQSLSTTLPTIVPIFLWSTSSGIGVDKGIIRSDVMWGVSSLVRQLQVPLTVNSKARRFLARLVPVRAS